MKTDKQNINLEGLLAEVEHAGRDARRRQELGEMIDRMAATPQSLSDSSSASGEPHRRHGAWWWTSRVAAAACILFFISTAVRIWFIPTENGGMQVAEADVPAIVNPGAADVVGPEEDEGNLRLASHQDLTKTLPTPYQRLTNSYHGGRRKGVDVPQQEPFTEVEVTTVETNDYLADIEAVDEAVDTAENHLVISNDIAAEEEVPQVSPEPQQPAPTVQPEPVAAEPKARKRSFLAGLIRLAEPSEMDGVTLALLEF